MSTWASIVIGDSEKSSMTISWRAEELRALHHVLFNRFEQVNKRGLRVTFHIGESRGNIERHFFLTPDRPIHFVYPNGEAPDVSEDFVKLIDNQIELGQTIHMPLTAGVEGDSLARNYLFGNS